LNFWKEASMSNTEIWNKFSRPPETALKQITAGRLSGKTDINPQWRMLAMTEAFGPCGIGWKYQINRMWTEAGHENVVFAFADISVFIKVDGKWSDPIPGIGGNKLVEKERNGMYNNDEAYKMAVTDALSVALKSLGVAADIYAGMWDGRAYIKGKDEAEEVGEYDDLDAAAQSWVNAINQADEPTSLAPLGVDLLKEPEKVQKACWPFYCQMWVKMIKTATSKEMLDEIGNVLAKEPKIVGDAVRADYKKQVAALKK
jgi:hypothetical protein